MGAGAIKAGGAIVEFSLKDGKMRTQLKRLQQRLAGFGAGLQKLGGVGLKAGGAIIGAFAGAVTAFAKAGDELNKMSARTGLSVEALSELKFAAQQSGSSLEAVEKGIRGMSRGILAASRGLSTANDNLADLGLTLADLEGKKPEKQFEIIAAKIAAIEDPSKRAALSMKVFGKSGSDLLPMFANGVEGMDALRQEARDLGIVMSTEDATAAADLTDALSRLYSQFKIMIIQVGAAVAGPLTEFANAVKQNFSGVIDWIKLNQDLVATIAKIGLVLSGVGATLVTFGGAFQLAAIAVGGLTTALTILLAHPVIAAIAAITAVVIVLANEFRSATDSANTFDDALSNIRGKRTLADSAELTQLAKRFQQLTEKTKLTNAEQKEARKIINELGYEYGVLAAYVDTSTGKIKNSQKAIAQLNAARGGKSTGLLGQQISFAESGLEVAKKKGATDADIRKRTEAIAKLREELAMTKRIIADSKPITSTVLLDDPVVPKVPTPDATAVGDKFGKDFFDGAQSGFSTFADFVADEIGELKLDAITFLDDVPDKLRDLMASMNSDDFGSDFGTKTAGLFNIAGLQSIQGGGSNEMLDLNRDQVKHLRNLDGRDRQREGLVVEP